MGDLGLSNRAATVRLSLMAPTVESGRARGRAMGGHALLWLCVTLALGCGDLGGIAAELSRSLVVIPDTVAPGDSLRVVLTLGNPTAQAASFTGLYACPAFLYVVRDATEVELDGSKFSCPSTVTRFRIAPRDSLTVIYPMTASVRAPGTPDPYTPAPVGTYRLRADLNMSLPDLETTLTVMAGSPAAGK